MSMHLAIQDWITVTAFTVWEFPTRQAPQSHAQVTESSLGFVVGVHLWMCKEGCVCVKDSYGSNLGMSPGTWDVLPAGLPLTANARCDSDLK